MQADNGFPVCLDLPGVDPDSVDITTEVKRKSRRRFRSGHGCRFVE